MKHSLRIFPIFSKVLFPLLALAYLSPLQAQDESSEKPEKEIPTFELSVCKLGEMEVPPIFVAEIKLDEEKKPIPTYLPVTVGEGNRSGLIKASLYPPVKLYTEGTGTDAEGNPIMKPIMDIPVKKADERVFLIFYHDAQGNPHHSFLDDSLGVHPAGTVRVANFSGNRIAFSAGGGTQPLAPGGNAVATPQFNPDKRFPFVYHVEGSPPYKSPTKLINFRDPSNRLLVLYTTIPQTHESSNGSSEKGKITKSFVPIDYLLVDKVK